MEKADYFTLIVEHMVNQGIEDQEQFMFFVTEMLPKMSMQQLAEQLEILENLV